MKHIIAFLTGVSFGLGICISGMANPGKVLNFFDMTGTFDPSLIFVMVGALLTTMFGYALISRTREKPVFETKFYLPARRAVDLKLIGGSVVFGIGWGIAGFCPGGAIPALGMMHTDTFVFTAAMIAGIILTRRYWPKTLR